jgi:hypothetical protein
MIDLFYSNPMRPTDAWWQRSNGILNGDHKASVNRDGSRGAGWIKRAVRFQNAFANATSDHDQMKVMADFAEIYWATRFHKLKLCPDWLLIPYSIEARIMARESDAEIAQGFGCWPKYIEAYEALFFNVRDRLDNHDFIFNTILGHEAANDKQHQQYDYAWKRIAYLRGTHALDAVMCGSANFTRVQRPEDVPSFFGELVRGTLQQKVAVASQLISPEDALCLASKTRNKTGKTKRVASPKTRRSKGAAQSSVEVDLKSMPLQSIPCETIEGIAAPTATGLTELNEVRVSESI